MKVVFDIDGTLADCSHRLRHIQKSPKDWTAFFEGIEDDKPIDGTVELCERLFDSSCRVELWTGRPERYRTATMQWLSKHVGIVPKVLKMRRDGDHRDDDVVKMEFVDPGSPPDLIFEDRARVVKAFRAAGYRVCQVAEGDF